MKTNLTTMMINSYNKAVSEDLKVYRNGAVGSEQNFVVVNQENANAYEVQVEEGKIVKCTCPHSHWRKTLCKHQIKVSLLHNMDIQQLKRVAI